MKQRINWETMTSKQRTAMKRIQKLGNLMFNAWDESYLLDLYCQADNLWNEYFPFEASQWGDDWFLAKRFNDCQKAIREAKQRGGCNVTVNLFGCTVQIDTVNNR